MGRISTTATRRHLQRLRTMQAIFTERYRRYAGRRDVKGGISLPTPRAAWICHAISRLGAAPMVASLTTINKPHQAAGSWTTRAGCPKASTAPLQVYLICGSAGSVTRTRLLHGHPPVQHKSQHLQRRGGGCARGLLPELRIGYEGFPQRSLWFPYLIIRAVDGKNDGLVTPESAMGAALKVPLPTVSTEVYPTVIWIDLKREGLQGI